VVVPVNTNTNTTNNNNINDKDKDNHGKLILNVSELVLEGLDQMDSLQLLDPSSTSLSPEWATSSNSITNKIQK